MLTWHPHADLASTCWCGAVSGESWQGTGKAFDIRWEPKWSIFGSGTVASSTAGIASAHNLWNGWSGWKFSICLRVSLSPIHHYWHWSIPNVFFLYIYERRLWNTPFFMCMMVFSSISACIHDMLLYLIFTTHGLQVRISPSTMCCQTLGVLASQNLGILSPTHKDP